MKSKLHISNIQWHTLYISILKGRNWDTVKEDWVKVWLKLNKANTKTWNSTHGIWGSDSKGLGSSLPLHLCCLEQTPLFWASLTLHVCSSLAEVSQLGHLQVEFPLQLRLQFYTESSHSLLSRILTLFTRPLCLSEIMEEEPMTLLILYLSYFQNHYQVDDTVEFCC